MTPRAAAFKAMKEIAFAILAITFSLVAVFLPLAFQKSITGRLFIEFAVALAGSVLVSAFVALTLTPMLSARILKPIHEAKHGRVFLAFERMFTGLSDRYRRKLEWAVRHRVVVMGVSLLILGMAVGFFKMLEQDFLPDEDKGRLFCFLGAPQGATSEYTDRMVRKMETIAKATPEVDGYFSAVALPFGGPGKGNEGLMFIRLKDERSRGVTDIVGGPNGLGAQFFNNIEGAFAIPILPKAIGGGFTQPFELVLQCQDLDALNRYAGELAGKLRASGYLAQARSKFEITKPELRIHIDRNRAAAMGVSIENLSRTLQILFGGLDLSKIKLGGKEYDVIAQLERSSRLTPSDLNRLYIRNDKGTLIQLSNVITYEEGAGPSAINHYNRFRAAAITATPVGVPLGTAVERTEALLASDLPAGFRYEWASDAKNLKDSGHELVLVFLLGLVIVYMVLAAQFESFLHPFTVILSVPLAAVGAFGALWLLHQVNRLGELLYGWTNYAPDPPAVVKILSHWVPRIPAMNINLFSDIGVILLVGLVTKNGILLVEFANQQVAAGKTALQAMTEAGAIRLRPILMTAMATIMGIMPIAIGFGAGAESRRPMAVAAVGGMITSTFLTLFVIPVVYTLLSDLAARWRGKSAGPGVPSVTEEATH
jgi:multidrug efflux pump subunit AcrB